MAESLYEVAVGGEIPPEDVADVGAVMLVRRRVETVLYAVPDDSALYGLLARLQALGIGVLEVRRVDPTTDTTLRSGRLDA